MVVEIFITMAAASSTERQQQQQQAVEASVNMRTIY